MHEEHENTAPSGAVMSESAMIFAASAAERAPVTPPPRVRSAELPIIPCLDEHIDFAIDSASNASAPSDSIIAKKLLAREQDDGELGFNASSGESALQLVFERMQYRSTAPSSYDSSSETLHAIKEKFNAISEACARRAESALRTECLTIGVVGDSGIGKSTLVRRLLRSTEIEDFERLPAVSPTTALDTFAASTLQPADLPTSDHPWNVMVVDTPGFGLHTDALSTIRPVLAYQTRAFQAAHADFTTRLPFPDLEHYHTVSRHGHMDCAVYMVLLRLKPVDVEYIKRLSAVTNVIICVVGAIGASRETIKELKKQVLAGIEAANLSIETFGMSISELTTLIDEDIEGVPPFALGNHFGSVELTGAATAAEPPSNSTVMVPDDDFDHLVDRIFRLHAADLRRATAKKFSRWRESLISVQAAAPSTTKSTGSSNTSSTSSRQRRTSSSAAGTHRRRIDRECDLGGPFTTSEVIWIVAAFGLLSVAFAVAAGGVMCGGVKWPGSGPGHGGGSGMYCGREGSLWGR
ncbi:hypothetical protein HDU87_002844 [Geranomyces variabilis]|uniref:Septin-type G domain-containing protein n=1 Tax=Geranomyces variabilis TaxID=109894 RepID=A0AAD5TNC0_9FUNG|nr:hypothetical protein HDU87_002844 [Geranomyces variabilis]